MTASHPTIGAHTKWSWGLLGKLFFGAVVIRWSYDLVLYGTMGKQGLMEADSYRYLEAAEQFARQISSGTIHGWGWLGPDLAMMPLFTWLLTIHVLLVGVLAPLSYVLFQGLLDAGICLLVYGIAGMVDRRYAVPAAIAAIINPTQIVLAGYVYTDTPFVFFSTLVLLASLRWLRAPTWSLALTIGIALGAAADCRILIVAWTPVLCVLLLLTMAVARKLSGQHIYQITSAALIFCLCIAPIAVRNKTQYGTWALTIQSGVHLALWIVPLVKEAQDGTPWAKGVDIMKSRLDNQHLPETTNPFESSRRYVELGREELKALGLPAIIKAWTIGAAINLGAPAIVQSPPVIQLPRTGFFSTSGNSPFEKIINFLFRSDNALYTWLLLLGLFGVTTVRLVQVLGLAAVVRGHLGPSGLSLLALWFLYILAINGPVASAKYRLPIEPVLAVLTGAGFCVLRDWWQTRQPGSPT